MSRILYVGLDNKGGPAAIGKYLRRLAEADGHEFVFATKFAHHGEREGWAKTLDQVGRGAPPDIIIFHQWPVPSLLERFPKALAYWLPMYEEITERSLELARSHAMAVVAPTIGVADFFTDVGAEVHMVRWSVDKPVRAKGRGGRYWFFPARTGGHNGRKNVHLFLSAFRKTYFERAPRVVISMVPGAQRKHKLPEGCEFAWAKNQDEYQELIRGAEWLISPSNTSGIELSVIDALHSGTAVLGTDCHPFTDHIYDGWNGLLAPSLEFKHGHLGIPKVEDGRVVSAYSTPIHRPTLEGLVSTLGKMASSRAPRIDYVGLAERKKNFEKFWSQLFRRVL